MSTIKWWKYLFQNNNRRYFAYDLLGEGGFGQVWSGVTDRNVPVAIKTIKPSSDGLRDFINWYNEQAIHLKCINHPHIITTYDQFRCQDGTLVIIMEKAEGSLNDFFQENVGVDPIAVCSIGVQILDALSFIHTQNIIHRDLSLKNILWFSNGVFKLSDFGISKELVSEEEYARTLIGLRHALPPELVFLGYSSFQSDIYQLGIALLTLLIGQHPISPRISFEECATLVASGVPRQIADELITKFPGLANIISKMLRRREDWRYQTADEAREDLQHELERREALESTLNKLQMMKSRNKPFLF